MGLPTLKAAICALQVGIASWYSQGHVTASGARYDTHALTAASRTLPFGTEIRVTNLDDPAMPTAVLRVTDRGPYIDGRILDVTPRAARILKFERAGKARIFIEVRCDAEAREH